MHKKAEELRNITLKELEVQFMFMSAQSFLLSQNPEHDYLSQAAREEKLRLPEVSSPLARETSISPPRVNPLKVHFLQS